MYETPSPTHGYVPLVLAFWAYIGLILSISFGVRELGAVDNVVVLVSIITAAFLLKVFVALFRRLTPKSPEIE